MVYRGQFDASRPGNGIPVTGKDLRAALDAVLAGKTTWAFQAPSVGCNIKWKAGNGRAILKATGTLDITTGFSFPEAPWFPPSRYRRFRSTPSGSALGTGCGGYRRDLKRPVNFSRDKPAAALSIPRNIIVEAMIAGEDQNGAAPKILEQLVHQAERAGTSDIHLQMRGKAAEVNFRLDGIIAPGTEFPADVAERVLAGSSSWRG